MSSLIIAIISIALIAAVALATMSYVGDSLTKGRTKADAAAFVAGAQQVAGAFAMYGASEGVEAADVAALVTGKYLSAAPKIAGVELALEAGTGTDTDPRRVSAVLDASNSATPEVCKAIQTSAGITDGAVGAAIVAGQAYGCYADASSSGAHTFYFRF